MHKYLSPSISYKRLTNSMPKKKRLAKSMPKKKKKQTAAVSQVKLLKERNEIRLRKRKHDSRQRQEKVKKELGQRQAKIAAQKKITDQAKTIDSNLFELFGKEGMKETEEEQDQLFGERYKWEKVTTLKSNNRFAKPTDEKVEDSKYTLFLKIKTDRAWKKWVTVKKSREGNNSGYGLFTARCFKKGETISIYWGKKGTLRTKYTMEINGELITANPGRLCLGAHYVQSSKFPGKSAKQNKIYNCVLRTDGSVQAVRNMRTDCELRAPYEWYESKKRGEICVEKGTFYCSCR